MAAHDVRVLQLHAAYRLQAGEERVIANEADVLRAGGHRVEQVIVPNPTSTLAALGGLVRSLHNSHAQRLVQRAITDFRPDVVHAHNTWYSLSSAALTAVRDADVPLVRTLHNYRTACIGADLFRDRQVCTACVGRSPVRGVLHRCYRNSAPLSAIAAAELSSNRRRHVHAQCDVIVAPSEFMAHRLREMDVPGDRLRVKQHFTPDLGERARPPSASSDVVFIGRLAEGKGLTTLLQAWERLVGRVTPTSLRLVVIGAGPLDTELREVAPRGVAFTGWCDGDVIRDRLLTARALVFPSTWFEPFGMVLIEAMSAGLPVVPTRVGAALDVVDPPHALTATPDDPSSLAAALDALDDATVDRVGAANRQRFLEHFSPAAGLAGLEQLYASAIERHRNERSVGNEGTVGNDGSAGNDGSVGNDGSAGR